MKLFFLLEVLYVPWWASSLTSKVVLHALHWSAEAWRYRNLAYWVLTYFWALVVTTVMLIVYKWVLLGRVKPGSLVAKSDWHRARVWFVEFVWYRVVIKYGGILFEENSCLPNWLLRALGAKVSLSANLIGSESVSVAEADLLSLSDGAMLSDCVLDCAGSDGRYQRIRVGRNAAVGLVARCGAGSRIEAGAVVAQQTIVVEGDVVAAGMVRFGQATLNKVGTGRGNSLRDDADRSQVLRRPKAEGRTYEPLSVRAAGADAAKRYEGCVVFEVCKRRRR
jgi:acetyltransferase-like isoleucine patch superfamily enzyme